MKWDCYVVRNPGAAKRWEMNRGTNRPSSAIIEDRTSVDADTKGAAIVAAREKMPKATGNNLIVEPARESRKRRT